VAAPYPTYHRPSKECLGSCEPRTNPVANLYFEDAEVGTSFLAGPYFVTKSEIIEFAKQFDPVPRHIDEEAPS
jgi:acyl dehydratase